MDPCVAVVALDGRHLFVTALLTRVNFGIGPIIIGIILLPYLLHDPCCLRSNTAKVKVTNQSQCAPVPPVTGDIYRAGVFSSGACSCSVSKVKNPVPLENFYWLQPVATDRKKTVHGVSTV